MEAAVTIVPSDKIIIVNGRCYVVEMSYPSGVHAIQWSGEKGHVEYTDDRPNLQIAADSYAEYVQPYVTAWQEVHALATAPPALAEMQAQAIVKVRAACERYILGAYSYTKQLNIIRQGLGYTPEDLTQMTAFIDEARAICEGAVVQINATTTPEELQSLMTSLEAAYENDVSV